MIGVISIVLVMIKQLWRSRTDRPRVFFLSATATLTTVGICVGDKARGKKQKYILIYRVFAVVSAVVFEEVDKVDNTNKNTCPSR